MITIRSVSWKDLLSTGDVPVKIEFNQDTTLITGTNGSGKTTLLEALVFGLYGVSYRGINKSQMVNNINKKGLVVEVEFSDGKHEWKVIRGIKPNIFEIWKDGQKLDQLSNVKDMQSILDTVLQMNVKTFKQIVVLGSTNYIPFMQLSAQHRREVVEDILDMGILSRMKETIQNSIREIDNRLQEVNLKLMKIEGATEARKDEIEKRYQKLEEEEQHIINELKKLQKERIDIKPEIQNEVELRHALMKIGKILAVLNEKRNSRLNSLKTLENLETCPTCFQKVPEDWKEKITAEILEEIEKIEENLKKVEEKKLLVESKIFSIEKVKKELDKLKVVAYQLKSRIEVVRKELQEIREVDECDFSLVEDKEKLLSEKRQLEVELKNYKEALKYLKDDGIRSIMVKKYLPYINRYINEYLRKLGLYINFELDETFKEHISLPLYKNYSYESFSEGEKVRINLALLFTWREIAKLKNSASCNLLVFDEILDGSTDDEGIQAFFGLMKELVNKDKLKIVVISHTQGIYDSKFDRVLEFRKEKGFSTVCQKA